MRRRAVRLTSLVEAGACIPLGLLTQRRADCTRAESLAVPFPRGRMQEGSRLTWRFHAHPALKSEERGAPIDVDGLPGDGARLARTKKESRARDFVCRLSAALQNHVQKSG